MAQARGPLNDDRFLAPTPDGTHVAELRVGPGSGGASAMWKTLIGVVCLLSVTGTAAADTPPPEATAPAEAAASEAVAHHGSAFVDPLGFALFGPRVGVEVGTGQLTA